MSDIRIQISLFLVDWINTEVRDQWKGHVKTALDIWLHETQAISWCGEERLAFQELHAVIQLLGYIKRDERMCANGKLHAAKYRALLHRPVAVREELTRVNWRCSQLKLPTQQAVLPPIYCSYLPSFLCGCSRCTFRNPQKVPIELPMP